MVLNVGDLAPEFSLISSEGLIYVLNQYKGYRALVIFFTSEECLYAKGLEEYLKNLAKEFHKKGVTFIAIHSNKEPGEIDLLWPNLYDSTQQIAQRYGVEKTPHFFLFDHHRMLIYSGRALDNPRFPKKSSREDLREALEELLDLRPITIAETAPVGSDILWHNRHPSEDLILV